MQLTSIHIAYKPAAQGKWQVSLLSETGAQFALYNSTGAVLWSMVETWRLEGKLVVFTDVPAPKGWN